MSDWTSGYVAEIDYTHDFFHDMTPTAMALAATSKGQKHGLAQPGLTYCELGCGQGFTANVLAAANPHIDFHAMDFNPAHIAGARDLAAEADLNNVHFYERSFADFEEEDSLPKQFDVIALHGVMSWVSEENQQLIIDFISRRLKSGGMVYVSYNSLSAWASMMPLRRILLDRAAQGAGPLEERIGEALNFAKTLEGAGAQYFKSNPMASAGLKNTGKMSANYLAHEMFNADWTPFHFADLAGGLSEAKLNFLGPTCVMDHVDDICLTAEQIAVLDGESDPVRRESLRDVLVNEQFRSDLFVKGGRRHTERGAIGAWFETPLALVKRFGGGPIKLSWRQGEIALDQAQYGPILQALRSGPATVRSLLDQGAFGQMTWAEISRLLTILVGSGTLSPCLPLEGAEGRLAGCQAFNLAVCKRAEDSETLRFLASPVTGGGVELDRFEQLFLLAYSEGKEDPMEWASLVWSILSAQGQRLNHEGRVLELDEENLAVLQARATAFAARRFPLCKMLGLIPAGTGDAAMSEVAETEMSEEALPVPAASQANHEAAA
ncbi:class I SAM-dependent methyltransferase [Pseudophaeobacter sp. EL27]|uniref:class I SAM-dependent methyltransferase n=1 Tax=Pseudophaeobacter sp. EL27 TaxID=2107580 RepID=UPI000EFC518C|nr:class I SAM-dependent methyltransferase [Pseudophaeobacter sp. EL27]